MLVAVTWPHATHKPQIFTAKIDVCLSVRAFVPSKMIPCNVFQAYRPHLSENEGIATSCIYTARETHPAPSQTCMFKLPMRRGVTWTHFKVNWHSQAVKPQIGFVYRADQMDVELPVDRDYAVSAHTMFTWAMPCVTLHENCGFYLAVHLPADTSQHDVLQVEFVGFEHLVPAENPDGYVFTINGQNQFALMYNDEEREFYMIRDNADHEHQFAIRASAEVVMHRPV